MLEDKNNATSCSQVGIPTLAGKLRHFTSALGNMLNALPPFSIYNQIPFPPPPPPPPFSVFPFSIPQTLSPSSSTTSTTVLTKFQRLTNAETRTTREKGHCFRSDEKFGLSHRRRNKELQVLWMENIEQNGLEEDIQ